MSIKHTEFMKLTQGTKSLIEYLHAFKNLLRYATEFVDTNVNIIASFKQGLGPKLMKTLANNKSATFNEFVSDALTQDNQNNIYAASKNRKRAFEVGASHAKALAAMRPQFHPPAPKFRPPQKKGANYSESEGVSQGLFCCSTKGRIRTRKFQCSTQQLVMLELQQAWPLGKKLPLFQEEQPKPG